MSMKNALSARLAGSPLWARWQRLAPREQTSLALLGSFLLAVILYLALWQPAQRSVHDARAYFEQQRELYGFIEQNTELARQMSRVNRVELAPEQLQGLVTQSAQQHGLVIASFDSSSDGGLLVSLPATSYGILLRWLDELQGQGVTLAEVSLNRAGEGQVDARLSLRAGS
ncbi:type II secretion system protein M [Stutzerimonas azotifigens]|uniref:Type II secretion system protein M n=1 Tax=Stutzerimonas azotifigens TaxID=291995 RepID=A0ABR5Z3L7_9GAMM|nr:type II secretion system protein M [Stutzerimonas azotifigens]MBA1274813.1 type II secretion system protein M [Stutzerimonas azotifigens]